VLQNERAQWKQIPRQLNSPVWLECEHPNGDCEDTGCDTAQSSDVWSSMHDVQCRLSVNHAFGYCIMQIYDAIPFTTETCEPEHTPPFPSKRATLR
jgi:hypothetical protein